MAAGKGATAPKRPSQSKVDEVKAKKKEKDTESPQAKPQASHSGSQAPSHTSQGPSNARARGEEARIEERKRDERDEERRREAESRDAESKKAEMPREKRPPYGQRTTASALHAAPSAPPADGDVTCGPKKKEHGKAKALPTFSKQPPAHPPAVPPAQPQQLPPPPEKKTHPQQQPPAHPPLQPPTLPPAQPPAQTPAPPAVPLNSMWADNKSSTVDFVGQPPAAEDSTAMALPPPPSIPPPPAPCGSLVTSVKPKAISPAPPAEMDPSMRNIQRPPPGIDLGLLLTGPAPGLSPQPVLPPPGIANAFPPDSALAPAEAAAVSAVQGLGTDSFFGGTGLGAPGLDFGGLQPGNGLGAIGFPPGISPKQPMPPQRALGLQRPGYGDGNPDGNDFLSDLRSDSRRMDK
ncbi:unnamed protein product [Durusdinium trenchii]|uniref:Uncharacterized protein n=1 Tax=Durusdinium trenchii TaxID=1381693 RepID=A0ABP0PR70_9DINO